MNISPWLRVCVLSTMASMGNSALADDGNFNQFWHTNAPSVRIIYPQEGAAFLLSDEIQICADADGFSNHVTGVTFFAGGTELGIVTNRMEDSDTYCLSVSNLTVGTYRLSAVAMDAGGITVTSSVVDISVVTNLPPKIYIAKPDDGEMILGPTNVIVEATAFDPDGTVANVQFFADAGSIGTVTNPPPTFVTNRWGVFPIKEPFRVTWSNAPIGVHVLTAVATDNDGTMATSAPVSITIVTDLPPCVRIESPENRSGYRAPATITIRANASDPDGSVAKVQFFANSNSLGTVTSPTTVTSRGWGARDYSLTWSNAAAGTYVLTAIATDNAGLNSTSAPVTVTVFPPPSPTVAILSPHNGQTLYSAPQNVKVSALETHFTNQIANVQFFAGATGIGTSTTSPYSSIIWSNVAPGAYTLTAIATDKGGIMATSAPVNITVVTNRPPSWWPQD